MKAQRETVVITVLFLQSRLYMDMSGQHHSQTAVLPERDLYLLYWRLGGP